MRKLIGVDDVIGNNLCISCGLCKNNSEFQDIGKDFPVELCPGAGEHTSLGNNHSEILFGKVLKSEIVQRNSDVDFRSSSTGVITELAKYLLRTSEVDQVLTADFKYSFGNVRAQYYLTERAAELDKVAGSKYCSVDYRDIFQEKFLPKVLIICTPCMAYSLKNIVRSLGADEILIIANFCGGFKPYASLDKLIQRVSKDASGPIKRFSFRGNGQPGYLTIDREDVTIQAKYPAYVKLTGYSKTKRCTLCSDATGELADFSFGDAWGLENDFIRAGQPCSTVLVRTQSAIKIWQSFINNSDFESKKIELSKLETSQKGLLSTKKHRQKARIKVYNFFGWQTPNLKNFPQNTSSIYMELKVIFTHTLNRTLERLGLYTHLGRNGLFHRAIQKISKHHYE